MSVEFVGVEVGGYMWRCRVIALNNRIEYRNWSISYASFTQKAISNNSTPLVTPSIYLQCHFAKIVGRTNFYKRSSHDLKVSNDNKSHDLGGQIRSPFLKAIRPWNSPFNKWIVTFAKWNVVPSCWNMSYILILFKLGQTFQLLINYSYQFHYQQSFPKKYEPLTPPEHNGDYTVILCGLKGSSCTIFVDFPRSKCVSEVHSAGKGSSKCAKCEDRQLC